MSDELSALAATLHAATHVEHAALAALRALMRMAEQALRSSRFAGLTFTAAGTLPIGGASDTGANTVVTVNGSAKTASNLAFSDWFDKDGAVTYAYETLVGSASDPGKRYVLTTPAPTPATGFSVTGPLTVTGSTWSA